MASRTKLALLAVCVALCGCTDPNSPGASDPTYQLRLSLTPQLQWAGVPDDCIAALSLSELGQVKGVTNRLSYFSRDWLRQRQQIRAIVADTCRAVAEAKAAGRPLPQGSSTGGAAATVGVSVSL